MRIFRVCCYVMSISFAHTVSVFSTESVLDHAIVSIYAVDCESGKVLLAKNCDLSMTPASCMKIVTTAAAFHLLGPDSRLQTHLAYDGTLDEEHTLHGNIFIQGGGDPCLGSDRILGFPSWKKQIELWADAIQALGIKKIEGKVLGDDSKWEKAHAVPSWTWEDLGNYYGAGASALSFHENLYSIFFSPGSGVGDRASLIRTDPPVTSLTFYNEVKTGPEGSGDCACIYGSEYSKKQFIRGTIPLGAEEFSIKGAIPDPAAFCAFLLKEELKQRGLVIVGASFQEGKIKTCFHATSSPTIQDIAHWTNQRSINLYAEHLLKKMGEVVYSEGSTEAGIKAVTNFWGSCDIDLAGFNMADGSGLSRKNLVTTKQLASVLVHMKKSQFFMPFFASLPELDSPMRAKSGSMSFVQGYAGYTGNVAFAVLINQCPQSAVMRDAMRDLLKEINELN